MAAAAAVVMPHLDDGVLSEILCRLPSEEAYRVAAVCRQWRAVLGQPTFLCRHLWPRPLPLLDDGRPYALIIQPRRRAGFTHLRLVAIDPADRVPVNVPLQPKYKDPKKRDRSPDIFDTANDNSVFRLLDPAVANDEADVHAELRDLPTEYGPVSSNLASTVMEPSPAEAAAAVPTTTMMDVSTQDAEPADATLGPPLEDYVVFFERTVPMLDISVVASHGRLLLCRSRRRYYVCDPAANRWLALPPSTVSPSSDANSGMYWNFDASTGLLALTIVLLVRRRHRRVLVDTFSSATGRWDARGLGAPGAARCMAATSPGIHAGTCFYWLSRRWRRGRAAGRHILRYDAARCGVSVLPEPLLAEDAKGRVGRSLGSVAGGLRLCAFDIRDESESMLPHGNDSDSDDDDEMEGVHGMWLMDAPSSAWRRVHEATVDDVSAYYFRMLFGEETPVDFASGCGEFILVVKWAKLLRYDLESGSKVELASLELGSGRLDTLYLRYNAFPFFK